MPRKPRPLDAALKAAIRSSGLTHYAIAKKASAAIAKEASVAPSMIDRFMMPDEDPRHRGLTLATAARVAAALGLELRPVAT